MNQDTADVIQKLLDKDEKVLWMGKPDVKKIFTLGDILLIPISVIFFIVSFIMMIHSIMILLGLTQEAGEGDFCLPFVGLCLLIFGFYFSFGRFICLKEEKKRTTYIVTNKQTIWLRPKSCSNHNY